MKTSMLTIPAVALVALFATAAVAEENAAVSPTVQAPQTRGWHGHMHGKACRSDVKKLCADVRIGEGRAGIEACLSSHEAQLSEPCATQRATRKAHKAEFQAACGHDVETLCASTRAAADAEAGEHVRGVFQCLKTHQAELSSSCATYRTALKAQHSRSFRGEEAPVQ